MHTFSQIDSALIMRTETGKAHQKTGAHARSVALCVENSRRNAGAHSCCILRQKL